MLSAHDLLAPLPASPLSMAGFLLNIWLKATLLLGAAGILAVILRKSPASTRHLVWSIALLALLTLPALSILVPPLNVPLLPAAASPTAFEANPDKAAEEGVRQAEATELEAPPARHMVWNIDITPDSTRARQALPASSAPAAE